MLRNKGNGVIPLSNYKNGVIPLSNYRNGVIPLVIMSLLSRSGPEMIGNWSVYILGCFGERGASPLSLLRFLYVLLLVFLVFPLLFGLSPCMGRLCPSFSMSFLCFHFRLFSLFFIYFLCR